MDSTSKSPESQGNGLELGPGVFLPASGFRRSVSRGSGPGGQNVNKVNSRVEIWVAVQALSGLDAAAQARLRALAGSRLTLADEIHLSCDEHRSQRANQEELFQRLRELVARSLIQPKRRHKTRPTRASRERRLKEKKLRGERKTHRRAPEQ